MKLLNYTTSYFAGALLVIITIWAGLFYYAMLDEIYNSIDDGLDNQKGLIIQKAAIDTTILTRNIAEEGDYSIHEIAVSGAIRFQDIYTDTSMYMQNENDFEPVRLLKTVFIQNGKYYQLNISTSMVEEDDLSAELLYAIIWLYIGLVVTILLLNNLLLKKIWSPFYLLIKQLKKFRLEKPAPVVIHKTRIDEFNLMNETVQRLLQGNVDAYSGQKRFIENASHELQTPLAISINKLERLADGKELNNEQLELVAGALDNLERLTRLNKSLLLLSKIENKQFEGEESVNINQILKRIAEDFSEQFGYNAVRLTIRENDQCVVMMNPDLATVMMSNLLKNALVHNQRDGFVEVEINENSLYIQNSGQAIALDREKLFTRFFKVNPGESPGLGLAIVKSIVNRYHFSIDYQFRGDHTITVDFSPHIR
jgi:signal transduction histidine kinase